MEGMAPEPFLGSMFLWSTLQCKAHRLHRSDQVGGKTVAGRYTSPFLVDEPLIYLVYRSDQPRGGSLAKETPFQKYAQAHKNP